MKKEVVVVPETPKTETKEKSEEVVVVPEPKKTEEPVTPTPAGEDKSGKQEEKKEE